ncbi:type IV pilin protein [Lysobacter fragariae]
MDSTSIVSRHARHRRVAGFTLMELMITVAIVAILAMIALPSYDWAMVKTRRGAAQGCLTEAAQYMERYYTTNMKYTGAVLPTCSSDVGGNYILSFSVAPDASKYTLQAVPQGHQADKETTCGTMTIDQTGKKTSTTTNCW